LLGVDAAHFSSLYAGAGIHRDLTRELRLFFAYQFAYTSFSDTSACTVGTVCDRSGQRHVVTVGLGWRPRPTRLD
jgi:hypothetical protein